MLIGRAPTYPGLTGLIDFSSGSTPSDLLRPDMRRGSPFRAGSVSIPAPGSPSDGFAGSGWAFRGNGTGSGSYLKCTPTNWANLACDMPGGVPTMFVDGTLVARVYLTGLATQWALLSRCTFWNHGFVWYYNGTRLGLEHVRSTQNGGCNALLTIPTGKWVTLVSAWSYKDSLGQCYVDGTKGTGESFAPGAGQHVDYGAVPLLIGNSDETGNSGVPNWGFDGYIGYMAHVRRYMAQEEIRAKWSGPRPWEQWGRKFSLLYFVSSPPPVVNTFTIAGVQRDILQRWSISEQLNERGTMRFGVKSMDGSYRPGLREVVDFNWFGIHFFAGHIHHTDEGGLGGYGVVPIVTDCGATDYNALPDRRKRAITLPAGTLKSQLLEVAELLEIYGTTVDPAQVNGPMMPEMVFTLGPITQVFDKLSLASGYAWNISYDNVISMFAPGTVDAPFDIEDNDARVVGDVRVSPTTVNYGNHITVKYTVPATQAFVYFIMDNLPSDDTTFKAAGQEFVFKNTPTDPNHVQIEATISDTLDNVVAVIDPLEEVTAFNQGGTRVDVFAADAGASGNSIQVESNDGNGGADFHWGVEGADVASHLYHGTDAALTGSVVAEDVPAQDGGANLFELVFEEPTVESEETAQAIADGYLVRSLVQPREIRYRTRLHGLHPGMKQHIEVTGRNVDGDCLITAVEITPEGSALFNYNVTAVEGLVITESHQEKWRRMGGRAA